MVNLDETLHKNELDLAGGEGISETVTKNDDEGKALTTLVGTRGRLGSPGATELGKHPVAGSVQSLQVFLGSARLNNNIITNKQTGRKDKEKKNDDEDEDGDASQ